MLDLDKKLAGLGINKRINFQELKNLSKKDGYIIICEEGTEYMDCANVNKSVYDITAIYQNFELHDYKRLCKNYIGENGMCDRKLSSSGEGDVCFPYNSEGFHCHGKTILVAEKLMVIDASIK